MVAVVVAVAVGVGVGVGVVVGVVVGVGVGVVVVVVVVVAGVVVVVVGVGVAVVVGGDMTDPRTLADRARALLDAATPGPWEFHPPWIVNADMDMVANGMNPDDPDAELIAAAPTLIADLADEIDRLRAELDRRTDPDLAAVLRVLKVPYGHAYIESAARMIDREGPT